MQSIFPTTFGFIQNLGAPQMIFIAILVLLLFGAKRLPELGRGMGSFIREFKKTTREIEDDIRSSIEEPPPSVRRPKNTQPIEQTTPTVDDSDDSAE